MSLHLIRSNKVEILFDELSTVLGSKHLGPFESEWLVTQNPGMTKWLSLQLASEFGIWANDQVYFPKRLLERSLYLMFGQKAKSVNRWNSESMALELYEIFTDPLLCDELGLISQYLTKQTGSAVRLELAQKIADCFDQYLVYRPDWIRQFELKGAPLVDSPHWDWQGKLWNLLCDRLPSGHWADLTEQFIQAIDSGQKPKGFPERISIFGLSTLPPSFIQLLRSISKATELYIYSLNPTDDFWADLIAPKKWIRASLDAEQKNINFEDQYHQQANSLLAFLGRMGQEFQALVVEQFAEVDEKDCYHWPEPVRLLDHLQEELAQTTATTQQQLSLPLDRSIQIFRAHTPLRELEQAKNQILLALKEDPHAQPRDFLVLVSDLETYLPLVAGVFNRTPKVPFSVADRSPVQLSPLLAQLFALLEQPKQRIELSYLLDWVRLEMIQTNFGFTLSTVDWLEELFSSAGVRWGLDESQKKTFGQPEENLNTWEFGIKRVLFGYAMSSDTLFEGVSPLMGVEGKDFEQLNGFFHFFEVFQGINRDLSTEKTLQDWVDFLNKVFKLLFSNGDESDPEAVGFQTLVARLASFADRKIRLDSQGLAQFLNQLVETDEPSHGFLSQGVTFSAMKPMRTVPFSQVFLLGLDARQFPSRVQPLSFDLTKEKPRLGDRSKKEDDKYLFLEAILAARDRLTISYVGLSSFDQSINPGSVVISELLEFLDQRFLLGGKKPSEVIQVDLPMFPFASLGFDPSKPVFANFDPLDFRSASAKTKSFEPPNLSLSSPSSDQEIGLSQLKGFYKDPLGGFFRQGLGLEFRDFSVTAQDREPQELDDLERYSLSAKIIDGLKEGQSKSTVFLNIKAQGLLPYNQAGINEFENAYDRVAVSFKAWKELTQGEFSPGLIKGELKLGCARLTGEVQREPRVMWSASKLGGKVFLSEWVEHLFANYVLGGCETHLLGRHTPGKSGWLFLLKPVSNPGAILESLAALFQQGLQEPLPLFPGPGYQWMDTQTLSSLKGNWQNSLGYGDFAEILERAFGYDQILFEKEFAGLQEKFTELSSVVFSPLRDSLEELQ